MQRLLASVAVLALAACGGGGVDPRRRYGRVNAGHRAHAGPIQTSGVQRTLVQQSLTSTD